MTTQIISRGLALLLTASYLADFASFRAAAAEPPILLHVDAREASLRVLHAKFSLPAQPGPLTLQYPKWIPGEHGPTGPIVDLTGLKLMAAGRPLSWRRDPLDHYAFQVEVPDDAKSVGVTLDYLLPTEPRGFTAAASSSPNLVVISWHTLLLYPQNAAARDLSFAVQLQLPAGWEYASALAPLSESADGVRFAPVTLETLVDSPLIAGAYLRTFDLAPGTSAAARLNVVADSAAALELKPEDRERFSNLMVEAGALFGARHYRKYDFLLTLSDAVAHFGMEHHESSDNRTPERMLIDDDLRTYWASRLPHELVHSWNGKYRRPAELATPDFHQPQRTELLWIYEGLTLYLDGVLTVRSGFWNQTNYLELLALSAAQLDHQRGRDWRPLVDTAVAAHLLYTARPEGASWRRGIDFYPESELVWLEADVIIRERTGGRHSLDDFCQRFFGGEGGSPRVATYTLDDVLATLNEVVAFDWRGFFQERVYAVNPRAPLGGLERGGWRLVYREQPSKLHKIVEAAQHETDLSFSLGLTLKEDGTVLDVIPGSPASRAGVGAGMKLLGVNSRRMKPERLREAINAGRNGALMEMLLENGDSFKTCRIDYKDGERYPHPEREAGKPDLIAEITKPRRK